MKATKIGSMPLVVEYDHRDSTVFIYDDDDQYGMNLVLGSDELKQICQWVAEQEASSEGQ